MPDSKQSQLRGMTWRHHRGYAPMIATSERFERENPGVAISWDQRSLQDFESQPLQELAAAYDLIIIDYPHLGSAVKSGLLVPLDEHDTEGRLAVHERSSVGPSHKSYAFDGHQWALAIDAATPVSIYRPGKLERPPVCWDEVVALSRERRVLIPLRAPHALICLMWVANNHGFGVAESREGFMSPADFRQCLYRLKQVAGNIDPVCFESDPIAVQDALSSGDDGPDYCLYSYGYISYAREGFRPRRLRYSNLPQVGNRGSAGSVLGGTGIAVSALGGHVPLAVQYAYWVTTGEIQENLYFDSGGQPGSGLAWESDNCNSKSWNFFIDTRETLEGAWLRPNYEGFLSFQTSGSQAISRCLKGEQSVEKTIQIVEDLYRSSWK